MLSTYSTIFKTLFFLALFWVLTLSQALAWQQVQVEVLLEEDDSFREMHQKAERKAFERAVLQEALRIVPGELKKDRQKALGEHLEWRVDDLVLGYRIYSREEIEDRLVLDMGVNLDTGALREILQRKGVYYTSIEPWRYDLHTRGADPGDFHLLQHLQKVTGTRVDSTADTSVELQRISPGEWSGKIEHEQKGIMHTASGMSMNQVWMDLWAYFFTRPSILAELTMDLELTTSGWGTTDAVMYFDNMLMSWEEEVESGNIEHVYTDVPSLKATWQLTTLNPDSLMERLQGYLSPRGIAFRINENHQQD